MPPVTPTSLTFPSTAAFREHASQHPEHFEGQNVEVAIRGQQFTMCMAPTVDPLSLEKGAYFHDSRGARHRLTAANANLFDSTGATGVHAILEVMNRLTQRMAAQHPVMPISESGRSTPEASGMTPHGDIARKLDLQGDGTFRYSLRTTPGTPAPTPMHGPMHRPEPTPRHRQPIPAPRSPTAPIPAPRSSTAPYPTIPVETRPTRPPSPVQITRPVAEVERFTPPYRPSPSTIEIMNAWRAANAAMAATPPAPRPAPPPAPRAELVVPTTPPQSVDIRLQLEARYTPGPNEPVPAADEVAELIQSVLAVNVFQLPGGGRMALSFRPNPDRNTHSTQTIPDFQSGRSSRAPRDSQDGNDNKEGPNRGSDHRDGRR